MKCIFNIFFIVIFSIFYCHSLFSQQNTFKGFVVDEEGLPVVGLKVSLGKGFVLTDKDGNFVAEVSDENKKLDNIQIFKRGHALRNWEKVKQENEEAIKIFTKYTAFDLLGKAFDEYGNLLSEANVALTSADPKIEAKTNTKGVFSMHIPSFVRVNKNSNFLINGRKVEQSGIEFQDKGGILHISLPIKMQTLVVFDEGNQRLTNFTLDVNNKSYTTNTNGEVKIRLGDKQDNSFKAADFELNEVKYLPTDRFIMLYLKPTEANAVVDNSSEPDTQKAVEVELAKTDTEDLIEIYSKDFNYIINELELEKQLLIERSNQIRTEMEKVASKMSAEKSLSQAEKDALHDYMKKLEEQLIENDLAYEDAQVKTKEIIDRMKTAMINKDSINSVTEEKLEEVVIEKEKVEKEQERDFIIFSVVACSLLSILGVTFITSRRIKKQRNELALVNRQLNDAKDELLENVKEINSQNQEIKEQSENLKSLNNVVLLKNKKITDNIRYALTVQEAILPEKERMERFFKDFFITYIPKDIVSGDFYWFAHIPAEDSNKEKIIVAAVDCTGHGVSGAFMSLIGSTLLNEIVNQRKIYDTAQILYELNLNVAKQLKQKEKANNDGMDVSLCCIEKQESNNYFINFSGAKRSFTYYDHKAKEIKSIRGDRKSVGGKQNIDYQFSKKEIRLHEGDSIYLDSDGLIDQNNAERERFGTKQLQNLLSDIADKPMPEQKNILEERLATYQAGTEQRDDILMMGIRL
ncbi:MAG: SpoIIE family protein phosphatase [Bacteroidota bacterium]